MKAAKETITADDGSKDDIQDEAFTSCINSIAAELCYQSKLPEDPVIADDGIIYERQELESKTNTKGFYTSSQLKRVMQILHASGKLDEKYKNKQSIDLSTIKAKAEGGNAESMVELGELYLNGEVIQRDSKAAYSWFALASEEQEHELATGRKADLLISGLGVVDTKFLLKHQLEDQVNDNTQVSSFY